MKKISLLMALVLVGMFSRAQETADSAIGSAPVLGSSGRTSCEYVQLWAGGPKWATFNVGATITSYANLTIGTDATTFYDYTDQAPYYNTANVGGFYAWNTPSLNGRNTTWNYNSVTTGIADVATTLWGSNWKTSTYEQLVDLQSETYTTWTWCDGSSKQYVPGCTLKGYKVTGKGEYADQSIFLPAAGYLDSNDGTVNYVSNSGYYWSGTECDSNYAYGLYFASNYQRVSNNGDRKYGLSVRAVLVESHVSALDAVSNEANITKFVRDGKIVIVRDGKEYDALGRQL